MQQVLVIHGGTTFAQYGEYVKSLSSKTITVDRLTYQPIWKERLQDNLGYAYQVLLPSMPNKTNARYSEWKTYFKNLETIMTDDCILIGHSLGAVFLAKYLSENNISYKIKATILIAAPHSDETEEDLTDFKMTAVTDLFTKQAGKVTFFFGSDDPVIAQSEIEKYQTEVPSAEFNILLAPDHFMRQDFPELAKVITELQ